MGEGGRGLLIPREKQKKVPKAVVADEESQAVEKPSENSRSDSEKSDATIDNQLVNISPVGALFVEQRLGVRKVTGPCTLTLYDNQSSPTIRSTWMAVGNSGFLIFLPYGDVTGRRCEVWPSLTASVADTWAWMQTSERPAPPAHRPEPGLPPELEAQLLTPA